MLFYRQSMHHNQYGTVVLTETQTLENGKVENKRVDQSKFTLPDVSSTRLSAVLEAGVDLKQVPSRVLPSPDSIEISFGSSESQENPQNNKEND